MEFSPPRFFHKRKNAFSKRNLWSCKLFLLGKWQVWDLSFNPKRSGQISIIPKPELRGFWGSSLTKPPFRVTSAGVVTIQPQKDAKHKRLQKFGDLPPEVDLNSIFLLNFCWASIFSLLNLIIFYHAKKVVLCVFHHQAQSQNPWI